MGPESGALEQGHGTGEKVGGSPALAGGVDGIALDGVRRRVRRAIDEGGEFRVKTHIGILVCR